jgi:hypothetical protein
VSPQGALDDSETNEIARMFRGIQGSDRLWARGPHGVRVSSILMSRRLRRSVVVVDGSEADGSCCDDGAETFESANPDSQSVLPITLFFALFSGRPQPSNTHSPSARMQLCLDAAVDPRQLPRIVGRPTIIEQVLNERGVSSPQNGWPHATIGPRLERSAFRPGSGERGN